MSDVTVTDKQDVALMEDDDLRKWISLHQRALIDEKMSEHWDDIKDDLNVLETEFKLRNPLIGVLEKLGDVLLKLGKEVETLHGQVSLINRKKECKDGNVKN